MKAVKYPPARWKGDGRRYGTLTSRYPICAIFHSTETASLPGYRGGDSAPHLSYIPQIREWVQHQNLDAWVGAMRKGNGPISANAKAIQVEIVCYSDKAVADQYNRLWVGNLTDENLDDLASFVAWLHSEQWITSFEVWMPGSSWRYGTTSPLRMRWDLFLPFPGVSAHGGAPDQSHWNTGALNLHHLAEQARKKAGSMDHTHIVNPTQTVPSWAAGDPWSRLAAAANLNPDSAPWEFYRYDMTWVYDRIILPLRQRVENLTREVSELRTSVNALSARVSALETETATGRHIRDTELRTHLANAPK